MEITGTKVLKKISNKSIIKSVDFSFKEGVNGLIGANGAGKTTLMRLITKYYKLSSGEIRINLENDTNLFDNETMYYDNLGYLPQDFRGISEFTGIEFLNYMKRAKNFSNKNNTVLEDLVDILSLDKFLKYKLKNLSGGTLRRVGVLQALINNPKILILDEPTAGLDPSERISLKNYLNDIAENRIIIVSTHIIQDIEDIASNVVIIDSGRVVLNECVNKVVSSMNGKTWRVKTDAKTLQVLRDKYPIRKIKEDESGFYEVVLLSESKPIDNSIKINANLEDVYLYYSEKKDDSYEF